MADWAGEFGVEYTNRQEIDLRKRTSIFVNITGYLKCIDRTLLEVGSNDGHNIDLLNKFCKFNVVGVEINPIIASKSNFPTIVGSAYNLPFPDSHFEVVMTAGVLIHLEDHKKAMDEIFRVSKKYIMSIEYMSEIEEKIEYREGVYCAAKPFDKYWEKYPLTLVKKGKMSDFGIDDGTDFSRTCKYVILEK